MCVCVYLFCIFIYVCARFVVRVWNINTYDAETRHTSIYMHTYISTDADLWNWICWNCVLRKNANDGSSREWDRDEMLSLRRIAHCANFHLSPVHRQYTTKQNNKHIISIHVQMCITNEQSDETKLEPSNRQKHKQMSSSILMCVLFLFFILDSLEKSGRLKWKG